MCHFLLLCDVAVLVCHWFTFLYVLMYLFVQHFLFGDVERETENENGRLSN